MALGQIAEGSWLLRAVLLDDRVVDIRVGDGVILEIGPDLERRSDDEVDVATGGLRVLPGLRDAHVHFTDWATERERHDVNLALASATSAQRCASGLARVLKAQWPGTGTVDVIRGTGFRQALWPSEPTKGILDRALPGRAVVLSSQDTHSSWWSSAALALLGIDHPTGYLREHESWDAMARLPRLDADEVDRLLGRAMAAAARRGVTSIVDYEFRGSLVDWQRRTDTGRLPLRVTAAVVRSQLDQAIDEGWRTGEVRGGVRVGHLKLFTDGALGSRSAWCDHAYVGEPDNHGMPLASREELAGLIGKAAGAGLSTAVHAIGDAANRAALGAFEDAGVGGRIEHAQLLDPADVARFAALGVVASVQPGHAPDDRDLAERWWADRLDRAYPLRTLRDAGARLVFGSDAPVSPLDPWRAIGAAVARTLDEQPPWLAGEAVSLTDALAASVDGPLRVGGPADLVVTQEDPWRVGALDLAELPVWGTMVGGRWTHREA